MNNPRGNVKALGLCLLALVLVCLGLIAVAHTEKALAMPSIGQQTGGPEVLTVEEGGISLTDVVTSPSLHYVTLPDDFRHVVVPTNTESVAPGYLFWSVRGSPEYLVIGDNTGDPIYYKRAESGHKNSDFKLLPDGSLSYMDGRANQVVIMDSTYTPIRTIEPGDSYTKFDGHDHLLLSNGNFLVEVQDTRIIDMSEFVPGGYPTATITAQVLQEIDPDDNVVWEWNSWDVFTFTDAVAIDLTAEEFDYVHINSMEEDADGGIIISSRRLDEVTKIARPSGDVVWRLGGVHNQFTLVGDGQWFVAQHDVRRLPNGNLTVYDNRCSPFRPYYPPCPPGYNVSRGVEYELDEVNMEITQVWEFWNRGEGIATGSTRRQSNGNTLIGWGRSNFGATEVDADSNVVWDAEFVGNPLVPELSDDSITTYRVVRYPWQGCPAQPPTLVAQYDEGGSISLYYSWNGATSVTEYEVYGGTSPNPTTLIATQLRTGFEDHTTIEHPRPVTYFFRVLPVTSDGCVPQYSNQAIVQPRAFATHVRIMPLPANQMLLGAIRIASAGGLPPVPDATVAVTWNIPPGGGYVVPRTLTTNANGFAYTFMYRVWPGTYTLELVGVTAPGYVYDPLLNREESATWSTP